MSDPEIRHAMQLIGIEVERANSLFPNDESEAVCELLRRSHENPDLKNGMLFMCALNVIREGREKSAASAAISPTTPCARSACSRERQTALNPSQVVGMEMKKLKPKRH
jgi:hypothetical protein